MQLFLVSLFFILNIKMSITDKRIMKDTLEVMIEQDENNLITCLGSESDDNILCWKAIIIGLPNTPYEGT
jgi:ubiquitin-protein ligase